MATEQKFIWHKTWEGRGQDIERRGRREHKREHYIYPSQAVTTLDTCLGRTWKSTAFTQLIMCVGPRDMLCMPWSHYLRNRRGQKPLVLPIQPQVWIKCCYIWQANEVIQFSSCTRDCRVIIIFTASSSSFRLNKQTKTFSELVLQHHPPLTTTFPGAPELFKK